MLTTVPLNREKIRELREERGWSIAEAARRAGMSRQAWHQVETGARPDPSYSTVQRIAKALQVSLDALAEDGGE